MPIIKTRYLILIAGTSLLFVPAAFGQTASSPASANSTATAKPGMATNQPVTVTAETSRQNQAAPTAR